MDAPQPVEPKPTPPDFDDVGLFGLSLRGWLTSMLTFTCCAAIFLPGVTVPPWLIGFTGLALGSYFKR